MRKSNLNQAGVYDKSNAQGIRKSLIISSEETKKIEIVFDNIFKDNIQNGITSLQELVSQKLDMMELAIDGVSNYLKDSCPDYAERGVLHIFLDLRNIVEKYLNQVDKLHSFFSDKLDFPEGSFRKNDK